MSGSYSFVDANGSRNDIVCHDHYCASSKNGAAFSNFLSTAGATCVPTRWTFAQQNGTLYGANDCRDAVFSYNGTTRINLSTSVPAGAIVEMTKDRLVIADVASAPNAVYYSQSGVYANFTTGLNSADAYVDYIGSMGDKTSALKYALGKLYIFKTTSITQCILGDQYSSRCFPVSSSIGTIDPLSIVEVPGAMYFRGNDRNYWRLDSDGLTLVSKKISNLVKSQNSGSVQSNTQTSQADFQAGVSSPTGTWDMVSVAGSMFPSTTTKIDTSSADFAAGTIPASLTATSVIGQLQFSSGTYPIPNGNFETGNLLNWTCSTSGGTCQVVAGGAISGTYGAQVYTNTTGSNVEGTVSILNPTDTVLYSRTYSTLGVSVITGLTLDLASLGYSTQTIKIQFKAFSDGNFATLTSGTFTAISSVTWQGVSQSGGFGWAQLDNINVNRYFDHSQSSATPAFFVSRVFDMGFSTTVGGPITVSSSIPNGATGGTNLALQVRSSPNGSSSWTNWTTLSNGDRIAQTNRYYQYGSSFTTSVGTSTPILYDTTLLAATTGTYTTTCIQPGANISGWGLLSCDTTLAGNGSIVYYATSAVSCAALPTGSPISWQTSVTNNATLSISVSSAVYIGFRSLLTSATDQAQINACTLYWNNGVVAPPVWGTYDSIKNAIYWTTSINNNATNNRVLKYDLNLDSWYPWGLNANAIRNISGTTYFGDSTGGYWNQYGGVSGDNGAAISAYWKSKDFGNPTNPFVDNTWNRISLVAKNQITGNMTVTYTTSNNASGSYTVSLATTSGVGYVHANQSLPLSSAYQFMNVKLSNNSLTPFEIDGMMLDYGSIPWTPRNP